nr:helix-turn-helix domain-containing protein [Brevibacterium zhoupengii]
MILQHPRGEVLLEFLEKVYDSGAPITELASALHVHRTTIYDRFQQLSLILGADPLDGVVRLELHLALKLRRWHSRAPFV